MLGRRCPCPGKSPAYSAKSRLTERCAERQPGGFEGFVPIAEDHSLDRPASLEDDALVGDDGRAALPTAPPEPDEGDDLLAGIDQIDELHAEFLPRIEPAIPRIERHVDRCDQSRAT